MRLLFVSPYVPSPIRVRPYNFIKALAGRDHEITLICQANPAHAADAEALDEMRQLCTHVEYVTLGKAALLRNTASAILGSLPLQAALNFDPAFLDAIRERVRRERFDAAHIEHLRGSALGYALPGLPTVLDSVDSISLLFERTLRGSASLKSRAMAFLDLARTRRYEASYWKQFDHVVVSSPEDAWALQILQERFAEAIPPGYDQRLTVIANGVDLSYFAPMALERSPETIVFSGKMGYHANEAAALFLVQEIMPLVWAQRATVQVLIVGSSPPRSIQALAADPRVAVTGFVDDLRPYLAQATLAICPLRYGVGIQNKVLEAMAMATPVLAAQQTAHALQAVADRDIVFASQPAGYAQAILGLLNDQERAEALGRAGRQYVEQYHSWEKAAERLEGIYRRLTQRGSAETDVDRLLRTAFS